MIESIKIKKHNDIFNSEIKEINFGKRNIIIGPKGGGKSTLFDLLANAANGTILSSTIEALNKHNLTLHSITIDGEEIPSSSLSEIKINKNKKEKEIAQIYDLRNDVIYQDDNIKKSLSDTTEFDKAKFDFAKEILETSREINNFIQKLRNVYDSIHTTTMLDHENINWFNAFYLKQEIKKSDDQLLFNLNYSDRDVKYKANEDLKILEKENEGYNNLINSLKMKISFYETREKSFISEHYSQESVKRFKEIIKNLKEIIALNQKEVMHISKIIKVVSSFNNAYKKVITELKKDTDEKNKMNKRMASYLSQSEDHFRNLAKRVKEANRHFEDFILKEVGIEFDNEKDAGSLLKLELKGKVVFEEEDKYNFLKTIMYNAKKIQTNVNNWIISAREKGSKDFDDSKIIAAMGRIIKERILVTADGQDYATMSLGQKSIYGIRHKFNKSVGKPMFLDQPEDNLDNYTIAKDVLSLINTKDEQLFIITHNANIGILSKPDKVVVGSFEAYEESKMDLNQYLEGTIKESDKHSDAAHYLEGGIKYIQDRLEIITKGEN